MQKGNEHNLSFRKEVKSVNDLEINFWPLLWQIAANVFGKPKTNTDFLPYNGEGFKLSIPSKWNPSKEREFPGQVLRYEDNFDSNSNVSVIITPTDKKSITDYGSPEEFLSKVNSLFLSFPNCQFS